MESLRERNRLETVGAFDVETSGEAYIAELFGARGDAMQEYADRVLGASIKRQLLQAGALIRADALDVRVGAQEALDAAERRLLTLRRNRLANLGINMADLFAVFTGRIAGMRDGTIEPAWIPKLEPLRETIQYAEKDDFIICASRPGQGKSSLMRFEFAHAALAGMPVTIFNLENGEIEYARYMISMTTGIDSLKLRDPRQLTERELETVRLAVDRAAEHPPDSRHDGRSFGGGNRAGRPPAHPALRDPPDRGGLPAADQERHPQQGPGRLRKLRHPAGHRPQLRGPGLGQLPDVRGKSSTAARTPSQNSPI